MPEPIIKIEKLSKEYKLGSQVSYLTMRDKLSSILSKKSKASSESFSALKNINLSIAPGETVGIIGRNGAGKSTLLKVLSQITPPTSGKITMNGRVASLLEVGTGFHPELTGRENIYLNGAILGMSRQEITDKFDEIVRFSEIEKFLDTPVKRYSSGMYVRLAFAVAAHLEPEILIIDEVLAVGDAQFQKKCLGKMSQVAKAGRTVLFVSHNMSSVSQFCSRAILLDKGKIIMDGATDKVIERYISSNKFDSAAWVDLKKTTKRKNSLETSLIKFTKAKISNSKGSAEKVIKFGEPFSVILEADVHEDVADVDLGFNVDTLHNTFVTSIYQSDFGNKRSFKKGKLKVEVKIDNVLTPGNYMLTLHVRGPKVLDWIPEAIDFQVLDVVWEGNKKTGIWKWYHGGTVRLPSKWNIKNDS